MCSISSTINPIIILFKVFINLDIFLTLITGTVSAEPSATFLTVSLISTESWSFIITAEILYASQIRRHAPKFLGSEISSIIEEFSL